MPGEKYEEGAQLNGRHFHVSPGPRLAQVTSRPSYSELSSQNSLRHSLGASKGVVNGKCESVVVSIVQWVTKASRDSVVRSLLGSSSLVIVHSREQGPRKRR